MPMSLALTAQSEDTTQGAHRIHELRGQSRWTSYIAVRRYNVTRYPEVKLPEVSGEWSWAAWPVPFSCACAAL